MRVRASVLVMVIVSGCAGGPLDEDGGTRTDGGEPADVVDAGSRDGGQLDAGTVDAGDVDAGDADAGPVDAGDVDAGALDAGDVDAGTQDAGVLDAGTDDAGSVDSGVIDAGIECLTDFHLCGSDCVSNSSATQCGQSCVSCSAPSNGVALCNSGSCDFACEVGFHRCGSQCQADDPTQCGQSCMACPPAAGGTFTHPTCVLGACAVSCIDSCGTSCVNRQVDTLNCGSCGHACGSGQRCSRGRCVTPCPNGIDFEGQVPQWGAFPRANVVLGLVQVADLDADGLNDLYVANDPYYPSVRQSDRGVGRGRFTPWGPSPDLAADLDQDGKPERITALGSTTTRIEWLDGGVATFTTPAVTHQLRVARGILYEGSESGLATLALDGALSWLISGEDVADFLVHDFDQDGLDDFIVRRDIPSQGKQLSLRRGLADGGVGAPTVIGAPLYSLSDDQLRELSLFDFTRDGILDIMSPWLTFRGLADGGFEEQNFATSVGPGVPFDVDGDGQKEWVKTRSGFLFAATPAADGGTVEVGLPLFSRGLTSESNIFVMRVGVGDVNNDGVEDLLYQSRKGEGGAYLAQDGGIRFHQTFNAAAFVFADVTLDGFADLVLPGEVWINDGTGRFTSPMSVPTAGGPMIAADLNADGVPEIIQGDRIFMSTSSAAFASVQSIPSGTPSATADFDRDGRMDILQAYPGPTRILRQGADAGFELGPAFTDEHPVVTDLDLDSWPDLVFRSTPVTWADNIRGNFVMRSIPACSSRDTFADFDNDGVGDLGCRSMTFGEWVFHHGLANGAFVASPPATMTLGGTGAGSGEPPGVGDFDGDGNLDLAYGFGVIYRGRGDGTFAPSETWAPFESPTRFPSAVDVDNDGRDDLVLTNSPTSAERVIVLRSVCR